VLHEPLTDDAARADDDVHDVLRDPGLERQLAEPDARERRQLRGLEDDRVPAGERGAELPRRDVEREVPRRDQPDDAERLAEGQVDPARDRDRLAEVLVDRARVEVEDVGNHPDLAARVAERLAHVARLDQRQLVRMLLDQRGESAEQARPIARRDGAPGGKRGLRCGDGAVGVLLGRGGKLGDPLLGRRIEDLDHRLRSR
jgi:hypothetical protein